MKTPRKLLFEKHEHTNARLDAIRKKIIQGMDSEDQTAVQSLHTFLHSIRWHLASMSAIWLAVMMLNLDSSSTPVMAVAKDDVSTPAQLLTSLRQNRHQLDLLMQPDEPIVALPPRRSDIKSIETA